jgi:hypothetical protein
MTHAAFDNEHRLTTDKITKRTEGKVATEVALYQSIKSLILSIISLCYQISHAWNTGSMSSLLSIFQSNGNATDAAGSQMGSVKKRGREEGRGPVDYNMLPGSTHGLMDEGRIYGKEENEDDDENEEKNGIENGSDIKNRIKNGSRSESMGENGNLNVDDDDEVTINLSPSKSPMHALNGTSSTLPLSPSSSSIDIIDTGKTSYSFLPNTPTAHTDIESMISSEIFFKAEGINVLCGEMNLFSSDGLMLQLRR